MVTMNTELEQGKIYFLDYGGNTQIVGRYKESNATNHVFYDLLHYWNGYETFKKNEHCVKSGIVEIRRSTKPEKHALIKSEIENDSI